MDSSLIICLTSFIQASSTLCWSTCYNTPPIPLLSYSPPLWWLEATLSPLLVCWKGLLTGLPASVFQQWGRGHDIPLLKSLSGNIQRLSQDHRLCRLQHFSVPLSSFLTLFSFIFQAPARVASWLKVLPTQGLSPCSFLPCSGKFFHYVSHLHFIQGFLQVSLTNEASLGTLIQNIHLEDSLINPKDSLTALCFCLHCSSLPATVSLLADWLIFCFPH